MAQSEKAPPGPEMPKEYAAFRELLRQVVTPDPKPALTPSSSDKG